MDNFDLQVTDFDAQTGSARVAVVGSPAGETGPLETILPSITLADLLSMSTEEIAAQAIAFTEAAMPRGVWNLWRESVGMSGDVGLRLRVRTSAASAASLPWELLYDDRQDAFLALNPDTPVVRYLEGSVPPRDVDPARPLRILLTSATPTDAQPANVGPQLDAIEEALKDAITDGDIELRRVDHLKTVDLSNELVRIDPHILHYTGHGQWSERGSEGYLVLEDDTGGIDPLAASVLSIFLKGRPVRLVVLNSCETAQSGATMWDGVAQALVRAGVPAVVAMRTLIGQQTAQTFAKTFYTGLAAGRPVDVALTDARQTLRGDRDSLDAAWLIPALFLRADETQLWTPPVEDLAEEASSRSGMPIGEISATNLAFGDQINYQQGATFNVGDKEEVNTGGGAYIRGNVHAEGDEFVAGNKVVHGDQVEGGKVGGDKITTGDVSGTGIAIGRGASASVTQGADLAELATALAPIIEAVNREADAKTEAEAQKQIEALQAELAKGKDADDSVIGDLLQGLVDLVPGAVSAVVAAFASPVLAGIAGPVTQHAVKWMKRSSG